MMFYNMRRMVFVILILSLVPLYCISAEFLVYDEVRTLTVAESGFFYFMYAPESPANWLSPDDYYNGQWHMRFEIFNQPTTSPVIMQCCIWADWNYPTSWCETCTGYEALLYGTGDIYEGYTTPSTWWKLNDDLVDFGRPGDFYTMGIVMRAENECIVTYKLDPPTSCWERVYEFCPMEVRITIVAVSNGSTFSGWPSYTAETSVRKPVILPNGGTHNDEVNVTLSCNTDGSAIYYTLDGSDPTQSSYLYMTPFTLTENTTVKAKAFKTGLDDSDTATASFIIAHPVLPASNLEEVKSYPNPFPASPGSELRFTNLTTNSLLKIYTLTGKLVCSLRESDFGNGEIRWDGLTANNTRIKPGLYIYTIQDGSNDGKSGKIVIQ